MRKFISTLLIIAMAFALALALPGSIQAESSGATIDLSDSNPPTSGTGWVYVSTYNIYIILDSADVTITGTSTNERRIEVANNATANVTLDNVSITGLGSTQSPLLLGNNANLTVTLEGKNNLTAGSYRAV
ncbi:MAG: hypothetical protein FWH20_09760, partial [Oscillospiraceae bacterium]|nr:hypothetical protein [Oscillospiraceae bacterium]